MRLGGAENVAALCSAKQNRKEKSLLFVHRYRSVYVKLTEYLIYVPIGLFFIFLWCKDYLDRLYSILPHWSSL